MNEVPKKIFIGYDGSAGANEIFADLPFAGLPRTAEALVVSVADFLVPPTPAETAAVKTRRRVPNRASKLDAAAALSTSAAQRLKALFPSWTVRSKAVYGAPAWALLEEADAFSADLIVIGAHGASKKGALLGDVVRQIFMQSRRPVRIARAPKPGMVTPRLLFAFDDSEEAAAVMDAILRRTWPEATVMRVMSVVPASIVLPVATPLPPKIPVTPFQSNLRERAREFRVEVEADLCRNAGYSATGIVVEGEPVNSIVHEADTWGASAILVGSRDLSFVRRLFLGSVSQRVAARATCSVEVIRHRVKSKGGEFDGAA